MGTPPPDLPSPRQHLSFHMWLITTYHLTHVVVFFVFLFVCLLVVTTDQDEAVYFSNSEDIEVVVSENGSRVVFASASTVVLETMDCNPNPSDRRIYWISGMKDNKSGAIKRGFPDSNGSMETVSTVRSSCVHGDFVFLVPVCAWRFCVFSSCVCMVIDFVFFISHGCVHGDFGVLVPMRAWRFCVISSHVCMEILCY